LLLLLRVAHAVAVLVLAARTAIINVNGLRMKIVTGIRVGNK
jgi:hypothetical protein